jgi:hypothetical protein
MENKINNPIYYPLLASEEINGGSMPKEEFRGVWDAFDKLPDDRKNILTSDAMPQKIKLAQQTFGLDDGVTEGLSVFVRWMFFGQVDQNGFQQGLKTLLSGFNPGQIEQIQKFVQSEILTVKPQVKAVARDEAAPVTESLPLLQAITKYEKLSQQIITNERIKVKSQQEPVRPSLVNWIKCYRDELGVGFHDSVQRGTFLFRSENCKRLTPPERERVNLILKSIEESYPLPIDTMRSEIVFPEYAALHPHPAAEPAQPAAQPGLQPLSPRLAVPENAPARIPSAAAAPASESPLRGAYLGGGMGISKNGPQEITPQGQDESISFSSNHVFPAEREAVAAPAAPQPAAPVAPRPAPRTPAPQPNPFRIRPVSRSAEDEE